MCLHRPLSGPYDPDALPVEIDHVEQTRTAAVLHLPGKLQRY